MEDNAYKELFDLNSKYLDDLQKASAKYEAKTGVSINCLNFSLAIWVIATTILFNAPVLHFILVLIYIILSVVLIAIVVFGWLKGLSATSFKKFCSFELNSDLNKKFLEGNRDIKNEIYKQICENLSKGISDFEGILESRKQNVQFASYFSIAALSISILLVFIVLFGKIYESYDFKIKSQVCIVECNNKNFNNIGELHENNEFERESAKQTDSASANR